MNYYMRKAEVQVVGPGRAPACSPPSPIRRRARRRPVHQRRRLELVPPKAWGWDPPQDPPIPAGEGESLALAGPASSPAEVLRL